MPDITKNIEVDEHYTITSSEVKGGATNEFLKGAIVGSSFAKLANMPKVIKVPYPVVGKVIYLKRAVRDAPIIIVEPLQVIKVPQKISEIPAKLLVSELKNKLIKQKLEPDYVVPFNPILKAVAQAKKPKVQEFFTMSEALAPRKEGRMKYSQLKRQSAMIEKLKEKSQPITKKKLGVQSAMVFRNAEQITTQRRIESQKKELRRDLKSEVLKASSMGKMLQATEGSSKLLKIENIRLQANVAGLNRALSTSNNVIKSIKTDIATNYVTKLRYQKDISRLQATLQKYAHMATGVSAYQGEFVQGGDVGEIVRARRKRQVAAIEQIAETRRKTTLSKQFNILGMKERR
jgi:hypothetical protein